MAPNGGDYSALIAAMESGFPDRGDRAPAAGGNYWGIWHQLSVDHGIVLFGQRIVIPQAARKNDLKNLHAAHQGIVRTNRRALQTVYWPGITKKITSLLSTCSTCQERLSINQQEPMMSDPLQMLFGHQLRLIIPAHCLAHAMCCKSVMGARDRQATINADFKTRYDLRSRDLKPLPIGTNVRVQDPKSKLWSHVGVVVEL
jgi:hypothetical protein